MYVVFFVIRIGSLSTLRLRCLQRFLGLNLRLPGSRNCFQEHEKEAVNSDLIQRACSSPLLTPSSHCYGLGHVTPHVATNYVSHKGNEKHNQKMGDHHNKWEAKRMVCLISYDASRQFTFCTVFCRFFTNIPIHNSLSIKSCKG